MMREIISKWPYHKSYFQVKFFLTNLARTIAGLWWDSFFFPDSLWIFDISLDIYRFNSPSPGSSWFIATTQLI